MYKIVLVLLTLHDWLAAHFTFDHLVGQMPRDVVCQHPVRERLTISDRGAEDADVAIRHDVFTQMPDQRLFVGERFVTGRVRADKMSRFVFLNLDPDAYTSLCRCKVCNRARLRRCWCRNREDRVPRGRSW